MASEKEALRIDRKFHFVGFHRPEEFIRAYGIEMEKPKVNMYEEALVKLFSNEGYSLAQEIQPRKKVPGGKDSSGEGSEIKYLEFSKNGTYISLRADILPPRDGGDKNAENGSVFWFTVSGKYSMELNGNSREGMEKFYNDFDKTGDGITSVLTKKFIPKSAPSKGDDQWRK